jgi:chromosome segregation ATPase
MPDIRNEQDITRIANLESENSQLKAELKSKSGAFEAKETDFKALSDKINLVSGERDSALKELNDSKDQVTALTNQLWDAEITGFIEKMKAEGKLKIDEVEGKKKKLLALRMSGAMYDETKTLYEAEKEEMSGRLPVIPTGSLGVQTSVGGNNISAELKSYNEKAR